MSIEEQINAARQEGYEIGYKEGFQDGRKYSPVVKLVGKAKRIQEIVCDYFKVDFDDLLTKSRKETVRYPRQVLMYLLVTETKMGPVAIGKVLNRDHTTVCHTREAVKNDIHTNEFVRRDVRILNEKISSCLHT